MNSAKECGNPRARILIFGDIYGIPQLLRHVPLANVAGLVVASNRPQYHDAIRKIAFENGLPLLFQPKPTSENYDAFKNGVKAMAPDLIWVHSYSMIVRDDVLNIPRFGGVNIHGALLPQYRGCNPTEWAIINGENITGVTLHEMTSGIDEGPIIDQKRVPLFFEDTWRSATDRVLDVTDGLIVDNIPSLLSGDWRATVQDETTARYHRRRFPDDGRFEWDQPVLEIYNLVRALVAPHPCASYLDPDGTVKLICDYKTPAQLTLLKYEQIGKPFLRGDLVYLMPIWNGAEAPKGLNTIVFSINRTRTEEVVGIGQLHDIDWERHSAGVMIDSAASDDHAEIEKEAKRLLTKYAVDELSVSVFH
jgi:methionyl-tRNA formyltransferase